MNKKTNARVAANIVSAVMFAKSTIASRIVGFILADTPVFVDDAESTDNYYKVRRPDGLEGFCLRRAIVKDTEVYA